MKRRPWLTLPIFTVLAAVPLAAQDPDQATGLRFQAPAGQDESITASNPGPYDPALLLVLSNIDGAPDRSELDSFEPGLVGKLHAIVLDDAVLLLARLRALAALADVGDYESFQLVTSIVEDEGQKVRLRIQAIWAIGNGFAEMNGRETVLSGILGHPDHGIRLHAVTSLAALGSPEAFEIIEAHRIRERHASVRGVLRDLRAEELEGSLILPPEGRLMRLPVDRLVPPMSLPPSPDVRQELER